MKELAFSVWLFLACVGVCACVRVSVRVCLSGRVRARKRKTIKIFVFSVLVC